MGFRNVSGIYEKNSFTLTGCNDPDTCLSTEAVRWEDRSSLFLCRKGRRCAEKSFDEILHWNIYFIEKGIQIVLLCSLGKNNFKKILRWIGKTLWIEMRLWFFLFCSNQVSFLSEMKLYTAEGKSYLELILKWSRLQEFGSMYISIFNTLVTLRTSAWGWMALCNDGLN